MAKVSKGSDAVLRNVPRGPVSNLNRTFGSVATGPRVGLYSRHRSNSRGHLIRIRCILRRNNRALAQRWE
jgi:hypothetical protein